MIEIKRLNNICYRRNEICSVYPFYIIYKCRTFELIQSSLRIIECNDMINIYVVEKKCL